MSSPDFAADWLTQHDLAGSRIFTSFFAGFGNFKDCPTADIAGCEANGLIDLDDILAVIGAFGGTILVVDEKKGSVFAGQAPGRRGSRSQRWWVEAHVAQKWWV